MTIWSQFYDRFGKFDGRLVAILFAIAATFILFLAGIVPAIEQTNRDVRSILFERSASGQVAVIEMDSQSLHAIGSWPWPRTVHADIINELSDKGASQIAFDVDFSSRSSEKADRVLADMITGIEAQIILATFRQKTSNQSNEYSENLPLESFRTNALLGSVNVHPDELGQVSGYSYGTRISGTPRPSLAAVMTNFNGEIDQSFLIDQSINLASVPRFSAIDIVNKKVARDQIEGRNFIIGATAIELGDHYATPNNGIIPGVFIHALAAETLMADRNLLALNGTIVLIIVIGLAVLRWKLMQSRASLLNRFILPLFGLLLIGSNWGLFAYAIIETQIALSLIFVLCLYLASWIIGMIGTMRRERNSDLMTGLPNAMAMMNAAQKKPNAKIAVAEIAKFAELESVLTSDEQAAALLSLAERLAMLADNETIYRTSKNQLAWLIAEPYHHRLDEHFKTAAAFSLAPTQAGNNAIRLKIHLGYNEGATDNWFGLFGDTSIAAHKATELGYRWMKYSKDINDVIGEKLTILNEIDQAIEGGQIWVAYQPKLDIKLDTVNAAEALVRWEHPERGLIGPDRFIPILEAEGRIADLTLHVLKTSLFDVARWASFGLKINCSVNVSAALLNDEDFVSSAIALVKNSALNMDQICFEITETAALSDLDRAKTVLQEIRKTGIKLSIDDFGTGQSNLSYMQGFPADEIKIDQSFIKLMANNDLDRVMVSSTIEMAHKMNFSVVAEGVEDLECLLLLEKFGCDVAQGWHIGKPVNADTFRDRWSAQQIAKSA